MDKSGRMLYFVPKPSDVCGAFPTLTPDKSKSPVPMISEFTSSRKRNGVSPSYCQSPTDAYPRNIQLGVMCDWKSSSNPLCNWVMPVSKYAPSILSLPKVPPNNRKRFAHEV